jgi:hypothetical protein
MDSDITLNGSEATWVMPRVDGELGGTYTGTFTFRCYLDPLRQLQSGREYRELLGSLAVQASDNEANLAFALTQLKHRIIKSPPFWSSTLQESGIAGNIGDLNVITLILDASIRAENLFKEKIQKERDELLNKTIEKGEELLAKEQE